MLDSFNAEKQTNTSAAIMSGNIILFAVTNAFVPFTAIKAHITPITIAYSGLNSKNTASPIEFAAPSIAANTIKLFTSKNASAAKWNFPTSLEFIPEICLEFTFAPIVKNRTLTKKMKIAEKSPKRIGETPKPKNETISLPLTNPAPKIAPNISTEIESELFNVVINTYTYI